VQIAPIQFDTAVDKVMRVIEAKRHILGSSDEAELVQTANDTQVCETTEL
jgi:hypothetical protein